MSAICRVSVDRNRRFAAFSCVPHRRAQSQTLFEVTNPDRQTPPSRNSFPPAAPLHFSSPGFAENYPRLAHNGNQDPLFILMTLATNPESARRTRKEKCPHRGLAPATDVSLIFFRPVKL